MCDYSLQGLPNRLAVAGEQLVTHRFPTGSIGMASPLDLAASENPSGGEEHRGFWSVIKSWFDPRLEMDRVAAVCIPPGARLKMSRVPEKMQRGYELRPAEEVRFVQLSADVYQYRDAIRFDNGCQQILQSLPEGVPFEVISLDGEETQPEVDLQTLESSLR
jgi:hypothetical protein